MNSIPDKNTIIVSGGGTGGHTFTSLKFLMLFKRWFPDKELIFIGSGNEFEKKAFEQTEDIILKFISTGKLRRSHDFRNITDLFSFFKGIFEAYSFMKKRAVCFFLSTGGYVSLGPSFAAKLLKIPLLVHEQTSVPGLANRISFRISDKNLFSFDSRIASDEKSVLTGNPFFPDLRRDIVEIRKKRNNQKPVLFITGGANGSKIINEFVLKNIEWMRKNFDIYLQYGTNIINIEAFEDKFLSLSESGFVAKRFFTSQELVSILGRCDCILGRSGAGTVADIIEYNIPSVLIPLKGSAGQEQLMNAKMLSQRDAAILLEEKDLSFNSLKQALVNVYINRERISIALENFPGFEEDRVRKIFEDIVFIKNN